MAEYLPRLQDRQFEPELQTGEEKREKKRKRFCKLCFNPIPFLKIQMKMLALTMLAQRLLAWVWDLCLLSKHMALDKSPGEQRKQFQSRLQHLKKKLHRILNLNKPMKLREKELSAGEETVGKMYLFLWCLFLNSQKNCFEVIITMQRLFRKILSMMKCEKCEKVETLKFSRNYFLG